jgi:hypothetical protein
LPHNEHGDQVGYKVVVGWKVSVVGSKVVGAKVGIWAFTIITVSHLDTKMSSNKYIILLNSIFCSVRCGRGKLLLMLEHKYDTVLL